MSRSNGQSTKYGLVNFWTLSGGLGSSSSSGGGLGAHNSIDARLLVLMVYDPIQQLKFLQGASLE